MSEETWTSAIVAARGLRKFYDTGDSRVEVLKNVNFVVNAGEMVAIRGVSGSGKTTLLNLVGGLDRLDEGRLWVAGHELQELDFAHLTRFRAVMVGFIFQFHNLIPTLTVEENVLAGLEAKRKLGPGDREAAVKILRQVGLEGHEKKFPSRLSGGQQQRVAIARALIKSPRLILADEPTGSLDEETGEAIIELLHSARRENQSAVIVVTHNPEVSRRADRIFEMHSGRLYEVDRGV